MYKCVNDEVAGPATRRHKARPRGRTTATDSTPESQESNAPTEKKRNLPAHPQPPPNHKSAGNDDHPRRNLPGTPSNNLASEKKLDYNTAMPSIEISIGKQELRLLDDHGDTLLQAPVSTGLNGTGCEEGSGRTPLGNFDIGEKIGNGEHPSTIFQARKPVGRWPHDVPLGMTEQDDCILSRILRLRGLDPDNANTWSRYIYIHGTNDTQHLGQPRSHGCIRLHPADMVRLFDLACEGMPVHILP